MGKNDSGEGRLPSSSEVYEKYLVPLIFEPFAVDLAARVASRPLGNVLEVAAGTGVVTRAMAEVLSAEVSIVATDLSPDLLALAEACSMNREVTWRQADALALPFEDESFDAVICQFGVMFFPDRAKAYAEAHRVLRPGGVFLFNAWDVVEENEFAATITEALGRLFPSDPPNFMERLPHSYLDIEEIRRDLEEGGFAKQAAIKTVTARSRAGTCEDAAIAFCQGTGFRSEIGTRGMDLTEATGHAAKAIGERFGRENVDGKIQARVVAVEK